jgi:hypothetical protein
VTFCRNVLSRIFKRAASAASGSPPALSRRAESAAPIFLGSLRRQSSKASRRGIGWSRKGNVSADFELGFDVAFTLGAPTEVDRHVPGDAPAQPRKTVRKLETDALVDPGRVAPGFELHFEIFHGFATEVRHRDVGARARRDCGHAHAPLPTLAAGQRPAHDAEAHGRAREEIRQARRHAAANGAAREAPDLRRSRSRPPRPGEPR